jgi:lysophospholipase L1-like esterase
LAAASPLCFAEQASLQKGDLVAIIGDSITEQKDYSVNIEAYLLACQSQLELKTMQFGWSGETAWGFRNRMANDCFRYHPTAATTCYGMNDGGYSPMDPNKAKSYRENQTAIVEGMKRAGVRLIVVGSPGCVDVNTFRHDRSLADMYNKTLGEERDIAKAVAAEQGVVFADVYDPMFEVMEKAEAKFGKGYEVAGGDGVHPGRNGHLIMAYAFLKALNVDANIGTITLDLSSDHADATEGHKVVSSGRGMAEIESTRYPFCFYGEKPAEPSSTRGILEFLPFNHDLNRLMLIVKGAGSAPKLKVTWGQQSKDFSGAELEKGINLAAEFLDNPFSGPFAKVLEAARNQQNFESGLIKGLVHDSAQYKSMVPQDAGLIDKIVDDASRKDTVLSDAARAAVVPVKHTIKVEVVK